MIKIAFVEDDYKTLSSINKKVTEEFSKLGINVETYQYLNGHDIIEEINNNSNCFDIIFLDIHLPDMLGMDIAKILREKYKDLLLVFVTAYDNYVFEAFDYDAFAYIRKNEFYDKIEGVIKRLVERYVNIHNERLFKNTNGQYKIRFKDVVYLDSDNHKISIHYNNNIIINITDSLSKLEQELSVYSFCRIHAGILVNLNYVYSIEKTYVVVNYGKIFKHLPVSRHRIKKVKEVFQLYLK